MKKLDPQIWVLVAGRFISQIGTGFTLFYAPIFFTKGVGLSATEVGIGLGSASIVGVAGRVLSGSLSDSPRVGCRRTLLFSAIVSTIASFVLAATRDFPTLVLGNLFAGMGIGLYWPASDTIVAHLTPPEHRREAYAWNRLADSLGLQVGVVLGGVIISTAGNYRLLFLVDGISFLLFLGVVWASIREPDTPTGSKSGNIWAGWMAALSDRPLLIFAVVNIVFTTYLAQLQTTLPLYLSNGTANATGFSAPWISGLFTWHIALSVLLQLPISRFLGRFGHCRALAISGGGWIVGFVLVWAVWAIPSYAVGWAVAGLGVLAIAMVAYTPSASALVADLAPPNLRGVYLSINSLCWAVGYAIGPPLGGWAMDRSDAISHGFWLGLAASVAVPWGILWVLDRELGRYSK
ncbi:MAG TPA: MFS transporter [Oscillatoriales cyanobacterium M59_W2019_021]|nr:MFS transporter [Oscillatoriales cyanobacterium M4454_W2019_049]HIK52253.1 MFS transporter [Oscillatoriales cyanobacterium M59_W2019_021]